MNSLYIHDQFNRPSGVNLLLSNSAAGCHRKNSFYSTSSSGDQYSRGSLTLFVALQNNRSMQSDYTGPCQKLTGIGLASRCMSHLIHKNKHIIKRYIG